jgi:threonine dehydrogenase-like Zn-dependent dehydrogenase
VLALRLDDALRLVQDQPEPARVPGEALVRLRIAGICDTDLQLARGYMGYRGVLGHEFIGEVVGADDTRWIGRRVVADINAGCGQCDDCTVRDGHHCSARTVLGILGRDGALAEYVAVPERCLVAVPDCVSDERAVFAEPIAAALHVLDDVAGVATGPIVVLGDGKLGQLVARALLSAQHDVVVVGHHRRKLELAAGAGARVCLENELSDSLRAVPCVVEATGSAQGVARALSLLRPRGTLILKTTIARPTDIDLTPIVINELTVVGSRCGDLSRAISALESEHIDPLPLIEARYPLKRADEAFTHAAQRGVLKVIVVNEAP